GVTLVGFQDRCHKPLGHLSIALFCAAKVDSFWIPTKFLDIFFQKKSLVLDSQCVTNYIKHY
ncbi:MAG: hypothetical protein J6T60_04865, partial [Bacteroidales bacterium]|nr:hypothetical protein [Bacteroidales bacterium]